VVDVVFAMLADRMDWIDRLSAVSGVPEPPHARENLEDEMSASEIDGPEETNVIELATFVDRVNRSL
jgi:hypothetical protein